MYYIVSGLKVLLRKAINFHSYCEVLGTVFAQSSYLMNICGEKNQLKQIKQEKKRMGIIGTILINHNVPSTKEKCQKLLSLTVNNIFSRQLPESGLYILVPPAANDGVQY